MSTTITFTGDTMADIAAKASAFFGTVISADAPPAAAAAGKGSKGSKAAKEETTPAPADDAPPEVTVEDIRAVAALFETDDEREHAIKIIADNGAESISGLKAKSATVRAKVLEELNAKLAKVVAARKKASLD